MHSTDTLPKKRSLGYWSVVSIGIGGMVGGGIFAVLGLITSGITLVVANLFDLSSISMMGSAGFLLIFAAVNASNFRLHKVTRSGRPLAVLGVIICLIALGALIWQRATESPKELWILVVMISVALLIEIIYRGITGRIIRPALQRKE